MVYFFVKNRDRCKLTACIFGVVVASILRALKTMVYFRMIGAGKDLPVEKRNSRLVPLRGFRLGVTSRGVQSGTVLEDPVDRNVQSRPAVLLAETSFCWGAGEILTGYGIEICKFVC